MLRPATEADIEEILDIYEPYVTDTTVTFEYSVPSLAEFTERFRRISSVYPYFVCEYNGRIVGYAYADIPFSVRSAYAWDVELSVYTESSAQRHGIGRALYETLHTALRKLGYRNAYALITGENERSISFHKCLGYRRAGIMKKSGFKLGRWIDVVWMEYLICDIGFHPAPPLPVTALGPAFYESICNYSERYISLK